MLKKPSNAIVLKVIVWKKIFLLNTFRKCINYFSVIPIGQITLQVVAKVKTLGTISSKPFTLQLTCNKRTYTVSNNLCCALWTPTRSLRRVKIFVYCHETANSVTKATLVTVVKKTTFVKDCLSAILAVLQLIVNSLLYFYLYRFQWQHLAPFSSYVHCCTAVWGKTSLFKNIKWTRYQGGDSIM